ncbi:hypothetical protein [Lentzea tibetensis]|uniref:hypothetical protein n=1 Tax=Lentzea tibetensis TaxID=2591470 RepID=UPI0016473DF9|nr:hypothetical protein [Lentzea tibetensis]
MGVWGRFLISGVVGGVAGATYTPALQHGVDAMCRSGGLECLGVAFLAIPVLVMVWTALAWLVLAAAQVRPTWLIAGLGPVFVFVIGFLVNAVDLKLSADPVIALGTLGAIAYAVAALAAEPLINRGTPS